MRSNRRLSLVLVTLCGGTIFAGACSVRPSPDSTSQSNPKQDPTNGSAAEEKPASKKEPVAANDGKELGKLDKDSPVVAKVPANAYSAAPPTPMPTGGQGLANQITAKPSPQIGDPYGVGAGAPIAPIAKEQILDPNGRYATTYRPGLGHLAAFEAAMAKGLVPVAEKEIISDVGGRFTPNFKLAEGKTLGLASDLERGLLPPSGGPIHFRLALESAPELSKGRPHLSVHLVLDVSGSMNGAPMESAKAAAQALVDKLDAGDDFSLVTFADAAEVTVADGLVGPRRAQIKALISEVHTLGGTNIGAGLQAAYGQAQAKSIPEDAMKVVLLLSDGQPTAGIQDPHQLADIALDGFQHGVQTSSFGLGESYDGALMSAIADEGAGGYYYLKDGGAIAPALATEIDQRLDPAATAVEVRIRLQKGVDVLRVYGSRKLTEAEATIIRKQEVAADAQAKTKLKIDKDRDTDTEGGMRFFIPAFASADGHSILLKLNVPPGVGKKDLALVQLKYKDVVHHKNVVEEIPLRALYADSDAASAATLDASVAKTVQGFGAGDALVEAAMKIAKGDKAGAVALLGEREALLRKAAEMLKEPEFKAEADRLHRLAEQAGGGGTIAEPMLMAMLLETAGHARLR